MSRKVGVLLLNLGSPDDATVSAVRRYLQQFLMDPCVIDIPLIARALLVYGPISIFRAPKSTHAYQSIWLKDSKRRHGSPLIHYSLESAHKLEKLLPADYRVEIGMRYQNPSIASALEKLRQADCQQILALPLYPQLALSSTITAEREVRRCLQTMGWQVQIKFLKPFYDHPQFVRAQAAQGADLWKSKRFDHVLFSFHGLPERQIDCLKPQGSNCLVDKNCCQSPTDENLRHCYRKQSYRNAQAIAQVLGLDANQWTVSFQSRLGRTPWIQPYTDQVLPDLLKAGKKRVLVFCPSFVADCLETLEEISIREREAFLKEGGEDLKLVPSLNDTNEWIETLKTFVSSPELYADSLEP